MNELVEAFIRAAKETQKAYFAPGVALWRLIKFMFKYMIDLTEELMGKKK